MSLERYLAVVCTAASLCIAGCSDVTPTRLDDSAIDQLASVDLFRPEKARVILDNDEAFATKLSLVESAASSIEMIYYVYWDDYSSSVFSEAVLAAVARGVDVRLLVDYATNYPKLDLFSMLEDAAAGGPGSLRVRFYNRPTRRIVQDAAFMTMDCSPALAEEPDAEEGGCDERKIEAIEHAFAGEEIGGRPVTGNISNLDVGKSGLFLSGWYAGRPEVMALAVTEGQNLDLEALTGSSGGAGAASGEHLESLKKLALTYWRSRSGSRFQRVRNKLKLSLAMLLYGSKIEQLTDSLSEYLPIRAGGEDRDWRDWEYLTDYLHQKLLLVDGDQVVLGGRNMGDSYHLSASSVQPHPLLGDHELFYDTDLYAELPADGGERFRQAFDRLWTFEAMVAGTADVRQHAPNDFVANKSAFEQAEAECAEVPDDVRRDCVDRVFATVAVSLEERLAGQRRQMAENAEHYRRAYSPEEPALIAAPSFDLDREARLAYLENIPFDKELPAAERVRQYGAWGMEETLAGKYLTRLWRDGMAEACARATAENPQRVVFVNAYYLPPANILQAAARMVDGGLDCRHVTVQVLTNSAATSNFKFINLIAHHGVKAFSEFYQKHDSAKRATFEFYEYREHPQVEKFCLHSKVTVLGEDIIIGSANADVRSYLMDSNNGMLIR
ncbi:MAG: phospholipase D-like domain-containing protein, partial [Thermoanaerobaculia bacterium]